MAEACLFVMHLDQITYRSNITSMESHINVGFGSDISISELASLVKKIVGFNGSISFDLSRPDGTCQKWMNSQLINQLGWTPKINLEQGLIKAYDDFKSHYQALRK
jgi:GDP-L-fucose synthase